MKTTDLLEAMRKNCGKIETRGLDAQTITAFCQTDSRLVDAIKEASAQSTHCQQRYPDLVGQDEAQQIETLQGKFLNFYTDETVNPYVPLAAKGPWIVTSCGSVIHDSGGYGMLGFGHNPPQILETLAKPFPMANIMTANVWQRTFTDALMNEIGCRRANKGGLFAKFLCLNSGSESVTIAARISDAHAARTANGRKIKFFSLAGGFHGRTDRPAQFSDSCLKAYRKELASFQGRDNLVTIEVNNIEQLRAAFAEAARENVFVEAMFMEPVMGEGDPGKAVTPEFYAAARELTQAANSLLVVDSIQAGLRAHGCLSIVDYPGFENLPAPDMETYSKALNAGQYPLSVLAMNDRAASAYTTGLYGNTMTANPRALAVACAVLDSVTPAVRSNISERGREFTEKLGALADRFKGVITNVQGTGLLFSVAIDPDAYDVVGHDGLEMELRKRGIGVIHGGTNCLRFTPVFDISGEEVDLVVAALANVLEEKPRK